MKVELMQTSVFGIQYHCSEEALEAIVETIEESFLPPECRLVQEPNNKYDNLAIAVVVGEDTKIGYLSRDVNRKVNKWLEQTDNIVAEISEVDMNAPDYQKIKLTISINGVDKDNCDDWHLAKSATVN